MPEQVEIPLDDVGSTQKNSRKHNSSALKTVKDFIMETDSETEISDDDSVESLKTAVTKNLTNMFGQSSTTSAVSTDSSDFSNPKNCPFCKIIHGDGDKVLARFDANSIKAECGLIIINDHKPASEIHLLAIPTERRKNVTDFNTSMRTAMLDKLYRHAKKMDSGFNVEDCLTGYHKGSAISVDHAHMHLVYPKSKMSWLSWLIFRQSFYFEDCSSHGNSVKF